MFGFIFGLILGYFIGMLGMSLAVICRDGKEKTIRKELLEGCERALRFGLNPSLEKKITEVVDRAKKNERIYAQSGRECKLGKEKNYASKRWEYGRNKREAIQGI